MIKLELDFASSYRKAIYEELVHYSGFDKNFIPEVMETFTEQGYLSKEIAQLFGMKVEIPL